MGQRRGSGGRRERAELLGRGASDVHVRVRAPNEAACQRPRTEAYGLSNRRRGVDALDALCVLHRRLFAKRRQSQIETPQRPPITTANHR